MINTCVFVGRVSNEIELKKTNNEISCCNFNLAVQRKNLDTTDFPPMAAYGKLAEIICKYVSKGELIGVRAVYQSHIKNNKKYYEFKIEEVQFLEKRNDGEYDDIEIPTAANDDISISYNGNNNIHQ